MSTADNPKAPGTRPERATMSTTRILVVDDEPRILRTLSLNLRVRHYEVQTATDGAHALIQAAAWPDFRR